jgi:hypothetical protein
MLKQWFSQRTLVLLLLAVAVHLGAWFFRDTIFSLPCLLAVGVTMGVFSYQNLRGGLLLAFFEIFIGGHGHLLDADFFGFALSLRMVIFVGVLTAWAILFFQKKVSLHWVPLRDLPWIIFMLAIAIGALIGFSQNDFSNAFDDLNSYASIAFLLPLLSLSWNQEDRRAILQTLMAAGMWIVGSTLLLSFLFTHLPGKASHEIYTFVRDSRLAEITLQTVSNSRGEVVEPWMAALFGADGYWYRIFMPSQFFVIVLLLLFVAAALALYKKERLSEWITIGLIGGSAALFLSYSRSFFLGLFCAGIFLIGLIWYFERPNLVHLLKRLSWIGICGAFGFGLAWMSIAVPIPAQPDLTEATFYETSADTSRSMAVSSRWQLLGPLMESIFASPILGSGFGKEVTYISDDPRIREIDPTGAYTTYRFEWGYQDLWLKMGLLGLVALVIYTASIALGVLFTLHTHGYKWILLGWLSGIAALFVIHIFSPYLNHPIGITTLMVILPFLDYQGLLASREDYRERKNIKTVAMAQPIASRHES